MSRSLLWVAALGAVALVGATAPRVTAQIPLGGPSAGPALNRPVSPPFSPYLNLTRRGQPAVNYYGLVRPELEFRNNFQNLQQQVQANRQGINQLADQGAGLPFTGHAAVFLNTGGYFLNMGGFGQAGGGAGPGPASPAGGSRFGGSPSQRFGGGGAGAPMSAAPASRFGGSYRR